MPGPRRSAALRYDGEGAPKVVATGSGRFADAIVERARAAGIPVHEDAALAEALARVELDTEIPPALYAAVAEALVWAYRLQRTA